MCQEMVLRRFIAIVGEHTEIKSMAINQNLKKKVRHKLNFSSKRSMKSSEMKSKSIGK